MLNAAGSGEAGTGGPVPGHVGQVTAVARRMRGERGRPLPFRRRFHACQVPMVIVDSHRRYLDANRSARLVFRLSLAEMRRKQIDDFTPKTALARLGRLWSHLVAHGEVAGNYNVRFDDGSELQIVFACVADMLPGEHLIVFAPAGWAEHELRTHPDLAGHPARGRLSTREREVLGLIAEGLSLSEIAERLSLSSATVRTHARNASVKLGARNRAHAVALALQLGAISPPPGPSGGGVGSR